MGKQHQTIPNEPEEMPQPQEQPEVTQPTKPEKGEMPQQTPDEIPPEPQEDIK